MKYLRFPLLRATFACVAVCLLVVSCASCNPRPPTVSVSENEELDVDWFILWTNLHKNLGPEARLTSEIVYELDKHYYASSKLDYSDLFNAALEGVDEELESRDVSWNYTKIRDSANRYECRYRYAEQFLKAEKLAKQKKIPAYDLAFASADKMLDSLGRSHTYFVYPKWHPKGVPITASTQTFVGIGVVLNKIGEDFVYIADVLKDSPAEKAGLKPFDKISAVDGQPVTGDLRKLSSMIRGKEGTEVVLQVVREMDMIMKFTITRGAVQHSFAEAKILEEGDRKFAYLEVRGFVRKEYDPNDDSGKYDIKTELFPRRINALAIDPGIFNAENDGLIIDLRGNPGGSIDALIWFFSCFLPDRTKLFTLENKNGEKVYSSNGEPRTSVPIVILIDEGTGSAAEIFAGTMQERGAATVVGVKSSGGVEVTSERPCLLDSSIYISEMQLYLPSGKCLEGVGVIPDFEVKMTEDDVWYCRDACVEKAKEILKNRSKK